ncbi:acyl-CoA thioesterase [Desulfonispora thiosulfatigenes DSM 11270]|uniref:Acyl-CoA thioesterase n=1 Tax=Desulfonispora thiosulfatigenes DSM 11270 TaxID=656914 RepID=A0A1W1V7K4_DESTI|nr:PaaI family thioesterase [Desulfonispora thiosulfatigenes]SMB89180.1 acyl-CoA thioesterase [Desulfonispora thiosulfatigenes DSM 11270]
MQIFREPENKGINSELFNNIIKSTEECAYYDHMDLFVSSLGKGEAEIEIPVQKKHFNSLNIVHGGVVFSLADTVMGMAINTMDTDCVTIDAQINYIKSGKAGDVIRAKGEVLKLGRKIIVTRAEVYNQKDEMLAVLNGTYYNTGEKISERPALKD